MKAFICSLITIFLLTSAVSFNGIYVTREIERLLEIADTFPMSAEESDEFLYCYENFSAEWKKFKKIVSLSVSSAEAEAIEETLRQLYSRFQSGSDSDMAAEAAALTEKLTELRKTESFGLGIL